MRERGFTAADFLRLHPGGQIGRNLNLRVRDVMHTGEEVAWAIAETTVRDLIVSMTQRPLGAACVLTAEGRLAGLITDGDLRRALLRHEEIRTLRAADLLTADPVCIEPEARLLDAVRLMERPGRQISVLPVCEPDGRCAGLLRLHDLYGG
jgi:arabinose-5-phosphate isomerase